jgi:PAS domain S-box-containing protein
MGVICLNEEDEFIIDLEETIEKIREIDEFAAFMIANMAAIVEQSDNAIIGMDSQGTILTWNNGARKMYNYSTAEAVGKNFSVLISPENPHELSCILEKVNEDQIIRKYETTRLKKDGSVLDVAITVSPLKDIKNNIIGVSTIEMDISERKEAEEALKKSEKKYRQLFNDDLTGDFIATLQGKIKECNPSFAGIYGFRGCEEAKEYDISQFNPDDWDNLIKRLKTDHKIRNHQTTHKRPDGVEIHVIANLVGIFNESDELTEVRGYIFEDTKSTPGPDRLKQNVI